MPGCLGGPPELPDHPAPDAAPRGRGRGRRRLEPGRRGPSRAGSDRPAARGRVGGRRRVGHPGRLRLAGPPAYRAGSRRAARRPRLRLGGPRWRRLARPGGPLSRPRGLDRPERVQLGAAAVAADGLLAHRRAAMRTREGHANISRAAFAGSPHTPMISQYWLVRPPPSKVRPERPRDRVRWDGIARSPLPRGLG